MKEKKMWLYQKETFDYAKQIARKLNDAPKELIIATALGIAAKYVARLDNEPVDEEVAMLMAYETVEHMFGEMSAALGSVHWDEMPTD